MVVPLWHPEPEAKLISFVELGWGRAVAGEGCLETKRKDQLRTVEQKAIRRVCPSPTQRDKEDRNSRQGGCQLIVSGWRKLMKAQCHGS